MNQQQLQFQPTSEQNVTAMPLLPLPDSVTTTFANQNVEDQTAIAMPSQAQGEQFLIEKAQIETKQSEAAKTSTTDIDILTDLLQSARKDTRRAQTVSLVWSSLFLITMLSITRMAFVDTLHSLFYLQTCFQMMMAMGVIFIGHIAHRSYRQRRELSRELEKPHDLSLIGKLIETLSIENTEVRNLTKQSLIRLLPNLQASDAALLTDVHRDRLLSLLAISPNDWGYRDLREQFSRSAYQREVEVRVAMLKALEQVGGAKELPVVERLSRGLPTLQSAARVPAEIRKAAEECLPFLQARVADQRASEQLLRASSANTTANEVLLRPAGSSSETFPEHLLRASETHVTG